MKIAGFTFVILAVSFGNSLAFRNVFDGKLVCLRRCPITRDPVCGSNGKTYRNECSLKNAACLRGKNITVDHKGPCDFQSTKCWNEGDSVEDECGRACTCKNGQFVRCCRMRKEFTDMTYEERVRYIETVKTASTHPKYKPHYERLLTMHKILFGTTIHAVKHFLPWHRWFILQYENLLQKIDCRVTVSYWDWSKVAGNISADPLWDDGDDSLGGNGMGLNHCVQTGPFKDSEWSLIDSAGDACLRRDFYGKVPNSIQVQLLLIILQHPSLFTIFSFIWEVYYHDVVHCAVNATMCIPDAASAPEFFMHHGFIDKIWWDWQSRSYDNKYIKFFLEQPGHMPGTPAKSKDYLDLNDMPGDKSERVCAKYVESSGRINKIIRGLSKKVLLSIPSEPLPPISNQVIQLFNISQAQLAQLKQESAPIRKEKKWSYYMSTNKRNALRGFDVSAVLRAEEDRKRGILKPEKEDENLMDKDKE